MKEYRRITVWDMRSLCIKNQWYTNGTNEEYENLMNKLRVENITTELLEELAIDINNHTTSDNEYKDDIESICFELNLMSYHSFIDDKKRKENEK